MDIKQVERHYAGMSDEELIRVTTLDAQGIRPEIFPVIEQELAKRKLSLALLAGVIAQNRTWEEWEIRAFAEKVRTLACPCCGDTTTRLNGTTTTTLKGILIFSVEDTVQIIACPDCLDKKNSRAILITALLGWWSLPSGLYKTPLALYRNLRARKQHNLDRPNDTMHQFTLEHIGMIEACKGNQEQLQTWLQHYA